MIGTLSRGCLQVRRRLLLLLNGRMEARAGAAVMRLIILLLTTQSQPPQETEKVIVVTETEKTYHSLMETTHPRLHATTAAATNSKTLRLTLLTNDNDIINTPK